MSQADVTKFRPVRVATTDAAVSGGATDGAPPIGSDPQFQMGPVAPSGLPTTGFAFILKKPSTAGATAGAGGFTVQCWFRDGVTYKWGSAVAVSVAFNQLWICPDVDAMDGVIFQITNILSNGNIDILFAEQ